MLQNYLKLFLRTLSKHKSFAAINIFGLSLGMSCVLFITLFINNELSYENQFQFSDRIYRVALERIYPDRVKRFASSSVMLAPTIKEHIPEIECATRLHRMFFQSEVRVQVKDEYFNESHFLFADSNYFKIFNHPFLSGNPNTALRDPASVVLTESTALRFFGKTDVVGELIKMDTIAVKVTGVIKDLLPTSHIQFDLLGSINLVDYLRYPLANNDWVHAWLYTYIRLKKEASVTSVGTQIKRLADSYGEANISASLGANYKSEGHHLNYFLQPIRQIHLRSNLESDVTPSSSIAYIYLLSLIAAVILLITVINYINLTISKSGDKSKEVGIRKTLGADDRRIRLQILGESMIICTISLLVACLVLALGWPYFTELIGKRILVSSFVRPEYLVYLFLFLVTISGIAGFYPAVVFSSLKTSTILKGELKAGKNSAALRNILMVVQFSIAVAMITSSITVFRQLKFLQSKDPGFSAENVLIIKQTQTLDQNYEAFLNQIKNLSVVERAGGASITAVPGNFLGSGIFVSVENPNIPDVRANTTVFDKDFFETLNFKLGEGRAFSDKFKDTLSVILNRSAVKAFDLKEPIGARIKQLNSNVNKVELIVVGVVEDYNFFSLHSPISPLIIFRTQPKAPASVIAVKVNQDQMEKAISALKSIWRTLNPNPFTYSILENDISLLYKSDANTARIFNVFTLLAIALSSIGLLGLTSQLAQQRLKEMAIRRVLGSTQREVALTFAKPFVTMTIYSIVIAFTVSFWLINQWLNTFAYRPPFSIQTYGLSAALAFAILFTSLGFQLGKLIKLNAVKLLKEN